MKHARKAISCLSGAFILICAMALSDALCASDNAPDEYNDIVAKQAPLTLADCYELALKKSETIAINKEVIKEAEAHYMQSLGLILPHLSYNSADTRQDVSKSNALYRRESSVRNFVVTQELFSGFKELAGISGSKIEKRQRINEEKRGEQLLMADVAGAFYLLVEVREDLKALSQTRQALLDRIEELKSRERLGKSRSSEAVNAKAQVYGVESAITADKKNEEMALDLLEFLVGRKVGGLRDDAKKISGVNSDAYYMSKVFQRPDVIAAKQAYEISRKQVTIAKSGLFPSVNVQGNYYTQRSTQPKTSEWDATLQVNVPIFNGTVTYGNIKEAAAISREAELAFRRVKRLAVQEIKDSCSNLKNDLASAKFLTKALGFARVNYILQKRDYEFSLVNNLDVLQAIQTLQDARRNYIHVFYETKRSYWQLQVSSGEFNPELVEGFNPVPVEGFNAEKLK